MLIAIVYGIAIWFSLIVFSLEENINVTTALQPFTKQTAFRMLMIPGMILMGIIPMLLALFSLIILICNFIYGREYETVYSWHRNSIYRLIQVIVFSCNVVPCFNKIRLLSLNKDYIIDVFTRENMKFCYAPLVVLAILILIMVSGFYLAYLCFVYR